MYHDSVLHDVHGHLVGDVSDDANVHKNDDDVRHMLNQYNLTLFIDLIFNDLFLSFPLSPISAQTQFHLISASPDLHVNAILIAIYNYHNI